MQGEPFIADLKVLQLGGCDVILGANWMWEHSPITFGLKNDKITIWKGEKRVILEGDTSSHEVKFITTRGLDNYLHKTTHGILVQLFNANVEAK